MNPQPSLTYDRRRISVPRVSGSILYDISHIAGPPYCFRTSGRRHFPAARDWSAVRSGTTKKWGNYTPSTHCSVSIEFIVFLDSGRASLYWEFPEIAHLTPYPVIGLPCAYALLVKFDLRNIDPFSSGNRRRMSRWFFFPVPGIYTHHENMVSMDSRPRPLRLLSIHC